MNLILSQNINSDLLPNASSTLYVLICCFKVRILKFFLHLTNFLIHFEKLKSSKPSRLFSLLFQNTYDEMVAYLINSQADPVNKQRLTEAFHELTEKIPLTADRMNRIRFRDNFDKFIVNVRGFLLVK